MRFETVRTQDCKEQALEAIKEGTKMLVSCLQITEMDSKGAETMLRWRKDKNILVF